MDHDPSGDPATTRAAGDAPDATGSWPAAAVTTDGPTPIHRDDASTDRAGLAHSAPEGRYEILGEIDRGGMGSVLRGRDAGLNRELALKVLLERHRGRPEIRRRFVEEAQIGGQLQHPGIVPVYDLGVLADGRPFFAMKLVRGRTLAAILRARAAPGDDLPRLLTIFEQVAQAVAYAHSRRVIHRDLKPSNIMVGAFGEVQVMDWGLAKVLGPDPEADPEAGSDAIDPGRDGSGSDATSAGSRLGTPAYMAPEQARGEVGLTGKPSDVFSLGSILCEILTGRPAYRGASTAELLRSAELADLDDARGRLDACGADPDLIALARRCLASEPSGRPTDASGVASAIAAHLAAVRERLRATEIARVEAVGRAEVESARAEAGRARLRMTLAAAASLLIAVLAGGGAFLALRLNAQARRAEADRIVGDALARAEALNAEAARSRGDALGAWRSAFDSAEKARDALTGRPARAELASRVEAIRASTERGLSRARDHADRLAADRRLARRLGEARLLGAAVKDGRFDSRAKLAAYASAFRGAGLDFDQQPPDAIAARLGPAEEAGEVAAALDDWSRLETSRLKPRLVAVAEAIDPAGNPLRRAIREGDLKTLAALAAGDSPRSLPPAGVTVLAAALQASGLRSEAARVLSEAVGRAPGDFWLNHTLGRVMQDSDPPRLDEAARYLTAALALRPESPGARLDLGSVLYALGRRAEAEGAYREAIRLDPAFADARFNLALALAARGRSSEAEEEYRAATRLDPTFARAHSHLGDLLHARGRFVEAEAEHRAAVRLRPESSGAHCALGKDLHALGRHAEAEAEHRAALRFDPANAMARSNLGLALSALGRHAEAEVEHREAIRLAPDDPRSRANLGHALVAQGRLPEAEGAYREAVRLDPTYALGYVNLGKVLTAQGRHAEALDALRRGHELGSTRADWRHPSDEWVRVAEGMAALEGRLPGIIKREDRPKDADEGMALARMCYDKGLYATASRLWGEVLGADPRLAEGRRAQRPYNAACCAALAGCGRGKDDPTPDDAARAALRSQALGWLQGELSAWDEVLEAGPAGDRPAVGRALAHWKADADLAGVRDEAELAKLPAAERKEWQALWARVNALLKKAKT